MSADLCDICCGEPYGRSEARRPATLTKCGHTYHNVRKKIRLLFKL